MGVYIGGAKLPKNCEECNFKVECRPYWERVREQYTRPFWCPCMEMTINEVIHTKIAELQMRSTFDKDGNYADMRGKECYTK